MLCSIVVMLQFGYEGSIILQCGDAGVLLQCDQGCVVLQCDNGDILLKCVHVLLLCGDGVVTSDGGVLKCSGDGGVLLQGSR